MQVEVLCAIPLSRAWDLVAVAGAQVALLDHMLSMIEQRTESLITLRNCSANPCSFNCRFFISDLIKE